MPPALFDTEPAAVITQLQALIGVPHVLTDAADLAFFSHDVVHAGPHRVVCVARPATIEELRAVVAACTSAAYAVVPRGGGASYTKGYLATTERSVLVDTTRLASIVAIDVDAMTVTVECGMTWKALYDTLRPLGVRTPFWGPMSGAFATIGGSLSNHAIILGAVRYGVSGDSVLGLEVVQADGSLLTAGSCGTLGRTSFYRNHGPDLTGLFLGDAGALGIKATASLRLIRTPPAVATASFTFLSHSALATASCELARSGVLSDCFGLDPVLRRQRTRRVAIEQGVPATPESLADVRYALHMGCEGRSDVGVTADAVAVRDICRAHGGTEIDDVVPRTLRQHPWVTMTSAIGPAGERWAPLHGIVPLTDAVNAWNAVRAIVADMKPMLDRLDIAVGTLTSLVSTTAFVLEPVCYWHGAMSPYAERIYSTEEKARFTRFAPDAESDDVVATLRERLLACFDARGAAHLQLGKAYHFRETRSPEQWALLTAIKRAVDANDRMNPGALGLSP